MCPDRKQSVKILAAFGAAAFTAIGAAAAEPPTGAAGGVALGDSEGGVTDRAYVIAPPHYLYVVEVQPGSFVDCGEGMDVAAADADGRHLAELTCGVTLTETVVIPAAASSARLTIHY